MEKERYSKVRLIGKTFFLAALVTCGLCTAASGATIYLKGGGKIEGDIVYEDKEMIRVQLSIGSTVIEKDIIERIEAEKRGFGLPEDVAPVEMEQAVADSQEVKDTVAEEPKVAEERDDIAEEPKVVEERDDVAGELALERDENLLLKEQITSLKKQFDETLISMQNEIDLLKDRLAETEQRLQEAQKELKEREALPEKSDAVSSMIPMQKDACQNLLQLRLPEETKALAEKINSFYYNFIDKDVRVIRGTVSDSHMESLIQKIEMRYKAADEEIADKMREIKIMATYRPAVDLLTFAVSESPEFETAQLNEVIQQVYIDPSIKVYKELIEEEMACLLPLINPKHDTVQSLEVDDNTFVITLLNESETSYWTFGKDFKLQSIERSGKAGEPPIKQLYEFETYESKYLVRSIVERTAGRYSKRMIEYQLVNGVKVPSRLLASTKDRAIDNTIIELYFKNVEVQTNN